MVASLIKRFQQLENVKRFLGFLWEKKDMTGLLVLQSMLDISFKAQELIPIMEYYHVWVWPVFFFFFWKFAFCFRQCLHLFFFFFFFWINAWRTG